jgi:hypothetical protein
MKMKNLLLIGLFALLSLNVYAQDADKIATLVATGQGTTTEEATGNALRSAIEQAFGTFISSKTEILNDSLIRDEIVSVSNGNIQKYELLSTQTLPNGLVANTVKATVSISKLTTFCESKGLSVEFKGGLFAANILLKELYEKNELSAWQNTKEIINNFIKNGFDFSISAKDPVLYKDSLYKVPLQITSNFNQNTHTALSVLYDFMKASTMSGNEVKDYIDLGKKVYPLTIGITEDKYGRFYFRNELVRDEISRLPKYLFKSALNQIKISNDLDQFTLDSYLKRVIKNSINLPINIIDNFEKPGSFIDGTAQFGLWRPNNEIFLTLKIINDNSYYDRNDIYIICPGCGSEKLSNFDQQDFPKVGRWSTWFTENFDYMNFQFLKTLVHEDFISNGKFPQPAYTSYISILKNGELFKLSLDDVRSLNELKKISNYEVQKN